MKQKILNYFFKVIWKFANHYIRKHNPIVIWVTWSVWKTSVRMIITQILQDNLKYKKVYTSPKNFNGELWLSLSILKIEEYKPTFIGFWKAITQVIFKSLFAKKYYDIIVLEYGIDHIGEMDFLLTIAKPDFWFFTKIDKVHCMQFETPDKTANEKFKMIYSTKNTVFLNYDDSYCRSAKNKLTIDKFYYNTTDIINYEDNDKIDILWMDYKLIKKDNTLRSKFDLYLKQEKYLEITTNMIWKENIWYICSTYVLLDIITYQSNNKSFLENNKGAKLVTELYLQPWRFSVLEWINDNLIIDSSYNAAPSSMKKVIENSLNIKNTLFPNKKLILCLGDMRELGDFMESEHRSLASIVSQSADIVFLVWENMNKYLYDELIKFWFNENNMKWFTKSHELGDHLKDFLIKSNDKFIILFKWSQNTIFMEQAIKPILKNPNDKVLLPRQQDWWLKKKK